MTPLRWGLLATASIGRVVVEATRGSAVTEFVAVAGRLRAEALMWRYHPRTTLARELVRDGAIGDPVGPGT